MLVHPLPVKGKKRLAHDLTGLCHRGWPHSCVFTTFKSQFLMSLTMTRLKAVWVPCFNPLILVRPFGPAFSEFTFFLFSVCIERSAFFGRKIHFWYLYYSNFMSMLAYLKMWCDFVRGAKRNAFPIRRNVILFIFSRYNECKEKLLPYLKKCGFNPKTDIYFLPCSGLTGSFLRSAPEEDLCPWYRWDLAVLWTIVWKSETARLTCQTV